MRRLDRREAAALEAIARGVFEAFDDNRPFAESVRSRMLVYPADYTMLTREQFRGLAIAAAGVGDREVYVVSFGAREDGWGATYDHCLVSLEDYCDYKPTPDALILEHMMFSPAGSWGVVTSHGGYALFGGSEAFIETLRQEIPGSEDEAVGALVRDWKYVGATWMAEWLLPLLEHTYGAESAARYWATS